MPRHRHSDPRLSVSFQSQTRWMAGEWKSWLKPNPTPFYPSIVRGKTPAILFATTLIPREPPPPRYSALRSRIIPFRVFCALKYKYAREKQILQERISLFFSLLFPLLFDLISEGSSYFRFSLLNKEKLLLVQRGAFVTRKFALVVGIFLEFDMFGNEKSNEFRKRMD
ncbi:hypothetical protein ANTPLA_LOCUS1123 [Anthophora plagiata]